MKFAPVALLALAAGVQAWNETSTAVPTSTRPPVTSTPLIPTTTQVPVTSSAVVPVTTPVVPVTTPAVPVTTPAVPVSPSFTPSPNPGAKVTVPMVGAALGSVAYGLFFLA